MIGASDTSPEDLPDRDDLAAEAEAYEDASESAGIDQAFELEHPEIAETLRLLQCVLRDCSPKSSDDAAQKLPELSRIGRFQIERCLGVGNFGSVWLGYDPLLKREVAIKVAHVRADARADLQQRFEQEARLAARLHHPNIVPVFEAGAEDGRLFIVSEFSDGPTMEDWLRGRTRPVDPVPAAELICQLADAAGHAHRAGLVHRDIKPGNVLLSITTDNHGNFVFVPRLTDFGLARDLTSDATLTSDGVLLGTAPYMPPEQATGDVVAQGPTSDVYSIGVTLYRMLTGSLPFEGATDFEVIQRIVREEPSAPCRRGSAVPRDLSAICMKCLEKRPSQRYSSAAELRDDLDRFLRKESTVAHPISAVTRLLRWAQSAPTVAALLLLLMVGVAAVMAGMALHMRQTERHSRELATALQTARDERRIADNHRELARETSYRSDIRLAFDLWRRGQIQPVREILAEQVEASNAGLRGPEWHVLQADVLAKYQELGQHDDAVTECVLSRDESIVYSVGADGFVRVWDARRGGQLRAFHPEIGGLHALALSPDESVLATGGQTWRHDRAQVLLLDAASGEPLKTWQSHETTIESIAFSPDGKWLAAGSRYQPVQLTRLADGASFTLNSDRRNRRVSFSPDSKLLSISASETHVVIWRLDGDEPERIWELQDIHDQEPYIARFAPSQSLLAITYSSGGNHVSLMDPAKRIGCGVALNDSGQGSAASFSCVAFRSDAGLLAAGNVAGAVTLWAPEATKFHPSARFLPIKTMFPHTARVTSVAVTNDSKLISGGEDGRVALTAPFKTGATHTPWKGLQINAVVVHDGDAFLACEDGTIRRHSIAIPTRAVTPVADESHAGIPPLPQVLLRGASPIRSLALSPCRPIIAAGTLHGGVSLCRLDDGEIIRQLAPERNADTNFSVRALAFSSDGKFLAHLGDDGLLKVHDLSSGNLKLSQRIGIGWSLAFVPGNQFVACGGRFEEIQFIDIHTGQHSHAVAGANTSALAVSRDGHWLASCHLNGKIQILDLTPGGTLRTIPGHPSFGEAVALSPSGRTAVSLDKTGGLQFTDVQTGTSYGGLRLPQWRANSDSLSIHCSDGALAVTATDPQARESSLFSWHWETTGGADIQTEKAESQTP